MVVERRRKGCWECNASLADLRSTPAGEERREKGEESFGLGAYYSVRDSNALERLGQPSQRQGRHRLSLSLLFSCFSLFSLGVTAAFPHSSRLVTREFALCFVTAARLLPGESARVFSPSRSRGVVFVRTRFRDSPRDLIGSGNAAGSLTAFLSFADVLSSFFFLYLFPRFFLVSLLSIFFFFLQERNVSAGVRLLRNFV